MDELRECPFCGGHARMGLMCGSVGVTCQLCGASLVNETKETAIAAWNARAPAVPDFDWKSAAERATKRAETAEAELSEARNRIKDFEDAISLLRDDDCLRHVAGWYASVQLCIKLLDAAPRVAAPAVPEGWRDIASAPKTGFFLGWSPDFPDVVACWKAEIFHSAIRPGTPKHLSANHYTHWRYIDTPLAAAFLKARVPKPMPVASTLDCLSAREMYARLADDRGAIMYNACREAVLRGKP